MIKRDYTLTIITIISYILPVSLSRKRFWLTLMCALSMLSTLCSNAQEVRHSIDRDSILIGEQITLQLAVETDTTDLVVFPEGPFNPLELLDSYKVDTTYADARYTLIKKYGLTKFDSGSYTIPRQRILVNQQPFMTDSFQVEVNNVQVDTTKQGLYDIKNIIEVDRASSDWLEYLLWILAVIAVIGGFLYWLLWRNKKKAAAEQQLPPFEQALASLKELDEKYVLPSQDASHDQVKIYYSNLTDIVRRYLQQEVYHRSLESTTAELVDKLHQERQEGRLELNRETINKLEEMLKTADLTKFARIAPAQGKAQADRLVAEQIVKEAKESLPEPTEEERLKDAVYREQQAKKRKRRLIVTGVIGTVGILIIAISILIGVKGFDYVQDKFIGHPTKELLEGDWVRSEYGYPPVVVTTPKVLKRVELQLPEELAAQMQTTSFAYGSVIDQFYVMILNARFDSDQPADLEKGSEGSIQMMEAQGAKNLLVKTEKFTTPNGAEGLKTYGTGEFPDNQEKTSFSRGSYTLLSFTSAGVMQQIIIVHKEEDRYAQQLAERIINSVELVKSSN